MSIENIIQNSFLRNVPMFLEEGYSMDEAIQMAFDRDEVMLATLASPGVKRCEAHQELFDAMAERAFSTLNQN